MNFKDYILEAVRKIAYQRVFDIYLKAILKDLEPTKKK